MSKEAIALLFAFGVPITWIAWIVMTIIEALREEKEYEKKKAQEKLQELNKDVNEQLIV